MPFFEQKGARWCRNIEVVTMDAWLAYRKAIKKYCKNAIICFDHFHLAQYFFYLGICNNTQRILDSLAGVKVS